MSKLIGDIGTEYNIPEIDIHELIGEIIYLFE